MSNDPKNPLDGGTYSGRLPEKLTKEDYLRAIKEFVETLPPKRNSPFGSLFGLPYGFPNVGLRLYEAPPPPPKLKLSRNVVVSDEFREEFDTWLLEMFGYAEPIIKQDKAYVFPRDGAAIVPHEMVRYLKDHAS